jgi:hypothetical protein
MEFNQQIHFIPDYDIIMLRSIVLVVFCLCGIEFVKALQKSVTFYNGTIGQLFTSGTLFWETYDEEKMSDYAVKGALFEGDEVSFVNDPFRCL